MGQHYFLDNSTIQECVSHDQRKLQLVKKTCEENVESAIDVFLEEASSVNSWQKHYQRHHRRHYLINYHCQFGSKTSSLSKKNLKDHKVNNNNKIILRRRQEWCLINNNNNNKNTKLIKIRQRTTNRSVYRTRRSPSRWKGHYQSLSWPGSPCQASHSRSAGASFS